MRLKEQIENLKKQAQKPPTFRTEAARKNYEAGRKQIAEWQKHPPTLEEALKKQREREQQANKYKNL